MVAVVALGLYTPASLLDVRGADAAYDDWIVVTGAAQGAAMLDLCSVLSCQSKLCLRLLVDYESPPPRPPLLSPGPFPLPLALGFGPEFTCHGGRGARLLTLVIAGTITDHPVRSTVESSNTDV